MKIYLRHYFIEEGDEDNRPAMNSQSEAYTNVKKAWLEYQPENANTIWLFVEFRSGKETAINYEPGWDEFWFENDEEE